MYCQACFWLHWRVTLGDAWNHYCNLNEDGQGRCEQHPHADLSTQEDRSENRHYQELRGRSGLPGRCGSKAFEPFDPEDIVRIMSELSSPAIHLADCSVYVGVMAFHETLRMSKLGKPIFLVQAMGIIRYKYPAPEILQVGVGRNALHEPLR